jgi:CRISPR system Cascade subunit CasD
MDILLLRFDAPLMSFGAPIVDNRGVIQPYPALSLMTGLLGNALGYDHSESETLEALQRRIRYAVRQDRRGERLRDYQTVDFSKPYMDDARAWTTRGELETRKGGSASSGTHIRLRDYWANAAYTVALTLDPAEASPGLDDVARALQHPERPLFIGRKTCLPAEPLLLKRTSQAQLIDALADLEAAPFPEDTPPQTTCAVWWPTSPDEDRRDDFVKEDMRRPVTDRRDWTNQIHVGQRWIAHGTLSFD